jgi:hypothetical protein
MGTYLVLKTESKSIEDLGGRHKVRLFINVDIFLTLSKG